jgi:phosphoribosylformylglycinamidine cyclo-ligase
MEKYDTIGQDLVAMCVNDIACSGAEPLFFLDYIAMARLEPDKHSEVIKGIAAACKTCKCALIGGETAEMPGVYSGNDYDLAGFAVGMVEKEEIIDGHTICLGDSLVGIHSSGFHSNGYSLVRKVVEDNSLNLNDTPPRFDKTLGEMLLEPTKLYSVLIQRLKDMHTIKAISHITGGGITENLPRVLPNSVQACISKQSWEVPPLMRYIQEMGKIDETEMLRVFNCGIGLILVVPSDQAEAVCDSAINCGEEASILGKIEKRKNGPIEIS